MGIKVKVIVTREEATLENRINEFIEGKDVTSIQYALTYNGASPVAYYSVSFSAMIIYNEQ